MDMVDGMDIVDNMDIVGQWIAFVSTLSMLSMRSTTSIHHSQE